MIAVYGLAAFAIAAGMTGWLVGRLARADLLDVPNERSNHERPTPRGAGIAVCAAVALCWGFALLVRDGEPLLGRTADVLLLLGGLALAALSYLDDVRGLPVLPRLAAQAAIVAAVLLATPSVSLTGHLPPAAERLLIGLAWIGLINVYNFMDGIDGVTGAVTIIIGAAAAALLASHGGPPTLAVVLVGACLGFLLYNWRPARIFLGDVGSVPIGFLVGGLLLALARRGEYAAALILPAYYLTDSGLTFLDRLRRGERVWRSHSGHAYQIAVRSGLPHDRVTLSVAAVAAVHAGLAAASTRFPWVSLTAAYLIALGMFLLLRRTASWRRPRRAAGDPRGGAGQGGAE